MGQRLVINIKHEGKVIANSYHHWSAYSLEAANLLKRILVAIDHLTVDDPLLVALNLLRVAGAELMEEELEEMQKRYPETKLLSEPHRNNGLIAITSEGMEENADWAEAMVCVDITNRTFDFGVLHAVSTIDYEPFVLGVSYDSFDNLPFEEIDNLLKAIAEAESLARFHKKVPCFETRDHKIYEVVN